MNLKCTVCLETTIPSFLTARPSNDLILAGQQQLILRWWNTRKRHYSVFISELVIKEAGRGDSLAARKRIDAIKRLPILEIDDETIKLGAKILKSGAIPQKAAADAGHVACGDLILTERTQEVINPKLCVNRIKPSCTAGPTSMRVVVGFPTSPPQKGEFRHSL